MSEQAETFDSPFVVTVGANITERDQVRAFEAAGVDRLVVSPWPRSREALDGMRRFADEMLC